uniref:Uncharacterized protein n=1 Tax=Magnetococcus massalia (strain MO-1) TaxID=451514 RepID=A0A1S7LKM5_MAGMO|nr:protein of unknown function [Candidatus Magnetococcus massalia]
MDRSTTGCWTCGAEGLVEVKPSNIQADLEPSHFAISDFHYGTTATIYRCPQCGFLQCSNLQETVSFYQDLVDPDYETGRAQRQQLARTTLLSLQKVLGAPLERRRLLDVGAGSGILLEEALALSMQAEGVEPSTWLCEQGAKKGLPLHNGVLPHPDLQGTFDLVTLMDVIEHVSEPLELLRQSAEHLSDSGLIAVATPDVHALAARLMGWRWWHYRVAHIGYFNKKTITLLFERAGLEVVTIMRPGWVFPARYLITRIQSYFPWSWRYHPGPWADRLNIPFNLFDSLLVVGRKRPVE